MRSWKLSETQAPTGHPVRDGVMKCDGANEPTSVELNNGSILTFIRTQTGYLWQTLSADSGANTLLSMHHARICNFVTNQCYFLVV